jgi:hypothetical protein
MAKNTTRRAKPKVSTLDFHFIKTANYRTHHADGAYGGLTPRGDVYFEFFVERLPTPNMITQSVSNEGILGDTIKTETKTGIIREIECGVVMDILSAKAFHEWLGTKINECETLLSQGSIGPIKPKQKNK